MKLCLFGATGPVGRQVIRQALQAGHEVTATTRNPDTFRSMDDLVTVIGGDIRDPRHVQDAVRGNDAVISTVGVPYTPRSVSTYSVGARNILDAMRAQDVDRLICVSSKELAGARGEPAQYQLLVSPLIRLLGRTLYADMRRMEAVLAASDLRWTIVRPACLFPRDEVSAYTRTTRHGPGVLSSTADVADALIREAVGDDPHVGGTVEVLTHDDTPPVLSAAAYQAFSSDR